MGKDKKVTDGTITFVLARSIGEAFLSSMARNTCRVLEDGAHYERRTYSNIGGIGILLVVSAVSQTRTALTAASNPRMHELLNKIVAVLRSFWHCTNANQNQWRNFAG